jgi:hypothetical protein
MLSLALSAALMPAIQSQAQPLTSPMYRAGNSIAQHSIIRWQGFYLLENESAAIAGAVHG